MDKKTYQQTLPRKRISAGCLLFDEQGRLLVVEPAYKSTWEIPGGVVEANESPRTAVIREMQEELGLSILPLRLLAVDYSGETETRTESLQFIFLGPTLTPEQIAAIRLPATELGSMRFLLPLEALELLNSKLRRRVQQALVARLSPDRVIYLEEQQLVGAPENE
jgi:ADP-ribose pyrophosphatase YjhB (NUDIX family)